MTRRPRPSGPSRRGAAIAELAIMLPLLVFLFVVCLDYARLFSTLSILSDCARDGALYFANHTTDTTANISQAALADASNLVSPAPTVALQGPTTDAAGYTYVTVTVSYAFTTVVTYPGVPQATTLSRRVIMPVIP